MASISSCSCLEKECFPQQDMHRIKHGDGNAQKKVVASLHLETDMDDFTCVHVSDCLIGTCMFDCEGGRRMKSGS